MSPYHIAMTGTMIAGLITINLQLIFGTNAQIWHWVDLFLAPFYLIVLGVISIELYGRFKHKIKLPSVVTSRSFEISVIVLLLVAMSAKQTAFAVKHAEGFSTPVEYQEALVWIDENLDETSSIGALKSQFIALVTAHSSARIVYPQYGNVQVTLKEYFERLGLVCILMGLEPEQLRQYFDKHAIELFGLSFPALTVDENLYIQKFVEDYEAGLYKLNDLKIKYRCTELLIDDTLYELLDMDNLPNYLNLIYSNSKVSIYQIDQLKLKQL